VYEKSIIIVFIGGFEYLDLWWSYLKRVSCFYMTVTGMYNVMS